MNILVSLCEKYQLSLVKNPSYFLDKRVFRLRLVEQQGELPDINETKLAGISDKLWKLGSLDEIKEKVSPDLFYFHVGMNMIGGWKGDGWWYIICEQADFVPYIPMTLDKLNCMEKKHVRRLREKSMEVWQENYSDFNNCRK